MVAHNAKTRNSSSLFLFILFGLALLTLAVVWARLIGVGIANNGGTTKTSFQSYANSKYHFSISYPQSWQLNATPDDGNIITLSSFQTQSEANGGAMTSLPLNMSKIDILVFDVEAGTTPQDLLDQQTGAVSAYQSNISSLKLDGLDALKITVPTAASLLHGNETNANYTSIYLTNGTHGYVIAGYAEPNLFDQIINTFHSN